MKASWCSRVSSAVAALEAVAPTSGQIVARLGEGHDLTGHHLDGTARTVLLFNDPL